MNVFATPGGYVVALTYGADTDWVKNVMAAGGCELETRGRHVRLIHPQLFHDERRLVMPGAIRPILHLLGVSDFLRLSAAPITDTSKTTDAASGRGATGP